jgi:hypothetical protein
MNNDFYQDLLGYLTISIRIVRLLNTVNNIMRCVRALPEASSYVSDLAGRENFNKNILKIDSNSNNKQTEHYGSPSLQTNLSDRQTFLYSTSKGPIIIFTFKCLLLGQERYISQCSKKRATHAYYSTLKI